MIAAHVLIFGSGPRLRSICAALVRDCGVDVHVLSFESREAAALRATTYSAQVLFLDARVAVEPQGFAELLRDPRDLIVASAIGWSGELAGQPAALKTRKPVDPAALEAWFASAGPRPKIGSWMEPVDQAARESADVAPVRCHAQGLGFSGYAALSRNLMIGLDGAGVDVAWSADFTETEAVDVPRQDRAKLSAMSAAHRANETPMVFHAPTFTDGRPFLGPLCKIFDIRSPIVITMYETDRVPARWAEQLSHCDQVWVPASFNIESFAAGGVPREKLAVIPMGLDFEHTLVDGPRLQIPHARGFTFLAVSEWTYRKGFDVLLAAYARAFAPEDDVTLVIRSHYAGLDIAAEIRRTLKELGLTPAKLPPILLLPQKLSPHEFSALYRTADAFVLPTRGEGFGVPCLEAMALGIPTISTGWGGSTDFLTERTGFPIAATLEAVPRKDSIQFPIFTGQRWAEPSVASTASAMRSVFDCRAQAQVIAARGAALARTAYNRETTARHALRALRQYAPKAMPKRHMVGTVSFAGDILSANGAGSAARGVMRGLEAQGLSVQAQAPFGSCAANAIRSDEAAFVKARLGHEAGDEDLPIVYARLADLGRLRISESTIIITAADEHVSDPDVLAALKKAKLVCVPSASCAAILERSGVEWGRLRVVPACIDTDFWTPEIGGQLGPNSEKFRFLSVTDWQGDDGWETLVTAFVTAFGASDSVMLSLSITNRAETERAGSRVEMDQGLGQRCVRDISALLNTRFPERTRSKDLPLIHLRFGTAAEEDMALYYGSHDAFALAPRARRSSRVFLEAMACGLPTIAPRAGAHLAFMSDENSYLVDVAPSDGARSLDLRWEVDVESLAIALRRVVDRPTERAQKGLGARHTVVANNSLLRAGLALQALIEQEQVVVPRLPSRLQTPGRTLCIVVTRSEDPTQIAQCLDYIRRNTTSVNASIIIRGEAVRSRGSDRSGILEIGTSVKDLLSATRRATHIAFLHDDVRVGPGWDCLLMDGLDGRVGAAIAVPQSNAEKPEDLRNQAGLDYDPLTLVDFEQAVIARELRSIGRGQYSSMIFPFCAMLDANALRTVAESSPADSADLNGLLARVLTVHPHVWSALDVWVQNAGGATGRHDVIRLAAQTPLIAGRA
jgi:glycosyltransferase involved in cell wall biosynthesis